MKDTLSVIGAGSWGTALANLLASNGHFVKLWVYEPDLAERMAAVRENTIYLPGVKLLEEVTPTSSLEEAVGGQKMIISAVPSHVARAVFAEIGKYIDEDCALLSATKGIDCEKLMTICQVMEETLPEGPNTRAAVISGPSFAREVSQGTPTAVVVASKERELALRFQKALMRENFRVYTSSDVIGVELGGAYKNVVAIAAGVSDGMGFGTNTRSALITRGLAEISRLGVAMGANPQTFAGLSGIGDLVLTCTGDLSRNRSVGLKLARGLSLEAILSGTRAVAEGVRTTRAILQLGEKYGVDVPIARAVYHILFNGKDPRAAVMELMTRQPKDELG